MAGLWEIQSALNKVKAVVLNYTEMEAKVREATSNETWGASSTLMQEIAQGTHNYQYFNEIMTTIYRRFTEKEARHWRQIYKSLTLLEYLVKNGSERVVDDARNHLSTIKYLRNFAFIDEKGKDQGINVRNRAKELADLLGDTERIKEERKKAKGNRNKYTGVGSDLGGGYGDSGGASRFGGFGSDSYGGGDGGYHDYQSGSAGGFKDSAEESRRYDDYPGRAAAASAAYSSAAPPSASAVAAPRPEIQKPPERDLFEFDADVPHTGGRAGADEWGNFSSAAPGTGGDDEFGDFTSVVPSQPAAVGFGNQAQYGAAPQAPFQQQAGNFGALAAVPQAQAAMPQQQAGNFGAFAAVPQAQAAMPQQQAGNFGAFAAVPQAQATAPQQAFFGTQSKATPGFPQQQQQNVGIWAGPAGGLGTAPQQDLFGSPPKPASGYLQQQPQQQQQQQQQQNVGGWPGSAGGFGTAPQSTAGGSTAGANSTAGQQHGNSGSSTAAAAGKTNIWSTNLNLVSLDSLGQTVSDKKDTGPSLNALSTPTQQVASGPGFGATMGGNVGAMGGGMMGGMGVMGGGQMPTTTRSGSISGQGYQQWPMGGGGMGGVGATGPGLGNQNKGGAAFGMNGMNAGQWSAATANAAGQYQPQNQNLNQGLNKQSGQQMNFF